MFVECKNRDRIDMKGRSNISTLIGAFVLLVHVSGMIGVMTSFKSFFIEMTAINLLFSFGLMMFFHELKSWKFWFYTVVIVSLGFLIEMFGVNTGYPFGEYFYGFPFGPQIKGTPPVIGLNWFVLTYGFAYLLRKIQVSVWLKSLIVGAAVTSLDILIEPVAIHLKYWTWTAEHVPVQNYITWFVCISIFSFFLYKMEKDSKLWENPIVKWILGAQVIYFSGIMIYLFYFL